MTAPACQPGYHRHAPATAPCTGCGAPCGPEDYLRTREGRKAVCRACWRRWTHRETKADRIRAVERVEGRA